MAKTRTNGTKTPQPKLTVDSTTSVNSHEHQNTEVSNFEQHTYNPSNSFKVSMEPEPPKKRGRPRKEAVAAKTVDAEQEPALSKPKTRKRNNSLTLDAVKGQPVSKRPKTKDDTLVTQLPCQQSKSKAQNQPGRDPLPDHLKRNVHPAVLPQKRSSTQEVAAEREAKRRAVEAKIRELEEAKDTLAEMDALEDIQIDEMEEDNPQRLSFAIRKRAHTELEADSDGEKFDFAGIEAIEDSSGDDQPTNNERVSA